MERKLTAILSADVKGYSRLMGDNEEATIRTLTAYREAMTTLIQQHRGRVVDSPGDNLLAEFASAVDAVQSAVAIQHALEVRNADLPDSRRMEYRLGINVGDVIIEGERLYGDGVNIAARLEGLAEPGGICISGTVYDQVENKLALSYEYVGEQEVKNIAKPVRVWRVQWNNEENQTAEDSARQKAKVKGQKSKLDEGNTSHWKRMIAVMVSLLFIAGGFFTVRYFLFPVPSPQPPAPSTQSLPLPDKPSLVVLPFVNMSEDLKQDYFSDGITEDLTTALSQIASLFVIARNSAFTYKGKAVKVQDVGKELGVQYVLEGSVRKASDHVRITAQLVDAITGHHLWAERYDRPLKDIFALQDEIVQKIVTTLKLQLTLREQGYLVRKTTDNLEAYDYFLRGLEAFNRATQEANVQARQLFEKALELDPQYAEAHALLGRAYLVEWIFQWSEDSQTLEWAFALEQKAITLDDSLPVAHGILSYVYLWKKQPEQAIAEAERAIDLDPNNAENYATVGQMLSVAGRPQEAIELVKKAMRLNPRYPVNYLFSLGMAYRLTGQYEEAVTALRRAIIRNPNYLPARRELAVTYSQLGQKKEAQAEAAEVLRISPNFSLGISFAP